MARLWKLRLRLEPSPSGPRWGGLFLIAQPSLPSGWGLREEPQVKVNTGRMGFPPPCSFIGGQDPWHAHRRGAGTLCGGWGHTSRVFWCCWSTRPGGVCLGPSVDTGKRVWLSLWGSSLHAHLSRLPIDPPVFPKHVQEDFFQCDISLPLLTLFPYLGWGHSSHRLLIFQNVASLVSVVIQHNGQKEKGASLFPR